MFGYLYTPEDELDLQYEIDEKYTPEMITEVIEEYKKDASAAPKAPSAGL